MVTREFESIFKNNLKFHFEKYKGSVSTTQIGQKTTFNIAIYLKDIYNTEKYELSKTAINPVSLTEFKKLMKINLTNYLITLKFKPIKNVKYLVKIVDNELLITITLSKIISNKDYEQLAIRLLNLISQISWFSLTGVKINV